MTTTHTETEDHKWGITLPDHPARTESPAFRAAKALAKKINATHDPFYGTGQIQQHHGGSLWVWDGQRWSLFLNLAGIEWSGQWLADPARVELLRQNAERLYAAFPATIPEMVRLGYHDAAAILTTPVTTPELVARFVDSIFNSCVPLPAPFHVGTLEATPQSGGQHHYPKAITDLQHIKVADYQLWVVDSQGHRTAVVPVAPRGSGNAQVAVAYATPGSDLHTAHAAATGRGEALILDASHPLAQQAFSGQR